MCVCAGQSQPFSRRTSSCQRSSTRQRLATFVLGFFHCFQIYTAYTGGDFPLGRLACHVQKTQLDDQPVTGTAARRVPSSHKQYCTVSAACFWRSCKKQQHARTAAQVQTVRACFTLSERANASSLRSGDSCRR